MNTTTAPQLRRARPRAERLRQRADLPALPPASRLVVASSAEHDFLVSNPRPDLTFDPQTLRMIEVR